MVEVIEASNPVRTDDSRHTRLGWWIVLGGVGGFLLWASFAPLDQGIPVSGIVEVATNRKEIQYQPGGIVDRILVREGDKVKAGQVLVRMNDVEVKSQADITRAQYDSALAAEARLLAEKDGRDRVDFPRELLARQSDPRVAQIIAAQTQLFSARTQSIRNELSATNQDIAGLDQQIAGLDAALESRKMQMQYLSEQVDSLRELARDGYVTRNRFLDVERQQAEIGASIAEYTGNLGHARSQVAALRLRRTQREQDYQKDVRQQLTDIQRDVAAYGSRLKGQDFELANAEVKSPVDGTVVGLSVFTPGGVVGPGAKMMDIVPLHDALIIEGHVPVDLIDKLHPGLRVDMTLPAFNRNTTPHVPGIVTEVSADRLTDQRTGQPYYTMRAKVAPEGLKLLANLKLRPGMPVEAFVKTGDRTMMSYLLKPLLDRIRTSMSED